jgi:hypothetical protein
VCFSTWFSVEQVVVIMGTALLPETAQLEAELLIQKISDITQCAICLNTCSEPKSLTCLHTFCLECLKKCFTTKTSGPCPLCRSECTLPAGGVDSLPHNFFMMHLLEVRTISAQLKGKTKACDLCCEGHETQQTEPVKVAEAYCGNCRQYLCEGCLL